MSWYVMFTSQPHPIYFSQHSSVTDHLNTHLLRRLLRRLLVSDMRRGEGHEFMQPRNQGRTKLVLRIRYQVSGIKVRCRKSYSSMPRETRRECRGNDHRSGFRASTLLLHRGHSALRETHWLLTSAIEHGNAHRRRNPLWDDKDVSRHRPSNRFGSAAEPYLCQTNVW